MGPPSENDIVTKLNMLYRRSKEEYEDHVEMLKGLGYRVFRNSEGNHMIALNKEHLQDIFGGIFGGL